MQVSTVEIEGLSIAIREAGPAEAPAFLLLHGWPQSSYAFERVIGRLAADYRVVAPDLATPLGLRDRAMLELMYSSGLRVSELVDLPLSGLNLGISLDNFAGHQVHRLYFLHSGLLNLSPSVVAGSPLPDS